MYIRHVTQTNQKTGKRYTTYRLVETYRNQDGKVRQTALLNLGSKFTIPQENWKLLSDSIEDICKGQKRLFPLEEGLEQEAKRIARLVIKKYAGLQRQQTKLESEVQVTDYQSVDVNSIRHTDVRKIGAEYVGYHASKQLSLSEVLSKAGFNQKQVKIAIGIIIGRLVKPGSDLSTHRYLQRYSAIDELLGTDFSALNIKSLYSISDKLLKNKTMIEEALYNREKDLFNLEDTVILYDLTNTYFEGRALRNPKAQYGRSKEKRRDCPLVTLGLKLDSSGFPKKSEVYSGNVSEPKTLKELLGQLVDDKSRPTIIMDAGIATEDNLKWLKEANYYYVVVSRKRQRKPDGDYDVVVKDHPKYPVKGKLIENEETGEYELYCHSEAMKAKTEQMTSKAAQRYEMELEKIANGLSKKTGTKKYEKIVERIGRIKEKYRKIANQYEVTVKSDDKKDRVIGIEWISREQKASGKQAGVYCLRTNRQDLDAKTFWKIYTTLTTVEASFRSLKSELGFRPIYHQNETRIDGHLFISLMAYHLLHTIRYQLKNKQIDISWDTIREILSTQCRITSCIQLKNEKTLQIRKTTSPDTDQAKIYNALGIETHPIKTEKVYL